MVDFGLRRAVSGNRLAYRPNEINPCPGCGQSHWMIGRMTAECAFCATAVPLHSGSGIGQNTRLTKSRAPLAA